MFHFHDTDRKTWDFQDLVRFLDLFANTPVNDNHHVLATLMKRKYVPAVLTTNFDIQHERALQNLGLKTCRLGLLGDVRRADPISQEEFNSGDYCVIARENWDYKQIRSYDEYASK